MNDTHLIAVQAHNGDPLGDQADGMNIVTAMTALAKRRRLLVVLPLALALVAMTIGLVSPKMYRSGTQLLPPQQAQAGTAALLAQLGGAAAAVAGTSSLKNPNDVFVAMLSSRTVADKVITRFDLRKVYGDASPAEARRALAGNTTVRAGKDGLITLEVEDTDPKRAADMANAYVEELMALTKVLAVTEAGQRRLFFEKQLGQAKDDLAGAELALKSALDKNGVISVDADSRAVIETVGRLRAQISAKEVQFNSLKAFVTPGNPEFKRVQEELSSLRGELSRLQNGRPGETAPGTDQRGLGNIKILRDVKYYQMLYELLAKQYEAARLDEAKDASVIQVLDRAVVAERRAHPRVLLMTLFGGLIGLVLALALVLTLEAKERFVATPRGLAQWNELRRRLGRPPRPAP